MSRETDGTRASGRAKKPANVNGKRGHFMLQCMASGQSGNDHARNPPKTESLRVPVFWHHIPQTWVSFLSLLLIDTVAREPRCEIRCDSQAGFRGETHFRGKIRLPSDLRVKHEDEKVKSGVFKHVRIITSERL